MLTVKLGKTNITVNKDAFGVLPLQRRNMDDAVAILRRALDSGINYFDTARAYTDSEEKIGNALAARRREFFLATKTTATTADGFWKDLETSLRLLKTDYIDVYQFHNPEFCPKPNGADGLYDAALEAKKQGKIRHIGITNHRLLIAKEAAQSGLYDTLQFPFCYLSGEKEIELVELCKKNNVGFIAMKALSGGLLHDIDAARAWLVQFDNVVPIWGIQHEHELTELLDAAKSGSTELSAAQKQKIEADRKELAGNFCRSCGYCLPCPADIKIFNCARMMLLLKRMPSEQWLTPAWQQEMAKIPNCKNCAHCKKNCPYGLDPPALLKQHYEGYQKYLKEKGITA
ncbi:MAG: aldo/keto reductase [Treponemataceae bacterium]|nr:MAG: aldo/keto reductase [Treponemataceae bacterium]